MESDRIRHMEKRVRECMQEKEDLLYEIRTLTQELQSLRDYNLRLLEYWDTDRKELVSSLREYGVILDCLNHEKQYTINLYAEVTALKLNEVIGLSKGEKEYICKHSGISTEDMDTFLEKFNELRLQYLTMNRPY